MKTRNRLLILICVLLSFCVIGVAYFLGDAGFGQSIFNQVASDFMYKLLLLILIDIIAIIIGVVHFFKYKDFDSK